MKETRESQTVTPPQTLRARTLRTGQWVLFRIVVSNVLLLVQFVVLARILDPAAFGAVSWVALVLALTDVLSQTGIDVSIVRSRGRIDGLLNPAWSFQVVFGLALAAFILLIAFPISIFQGSPGLFGLLALAAVVPALSGFGSMGPVLNARNLSQGRNTVAELTVQVIAFVAVIALAYWLRSPVAIVHGLIVFTILRIASSYFVHPHRPRFTLCWSPIRHLLRFGLTFNLAAIVGWLMSGLDKIMIGRALGLPLLGLYDRALVLSNFPVNQLPRFLAAVLIPSFSNVTDPVRFARLTRRYLQALVLLLGGGAILVLLVADPIVLAILGPDLQGALPLFHLLVVLAAIRGLNLGILVVSDTVGRPQVKLMAHLVQTGVLIALLPLGIGLFGIQGACWGVIAAAGVGLATSGFFAIRGSLKLPDRPAETEPDPEDLPDANASRECPVPTT